MRIPVLLLLLSTVTACNSFSMSKDYHLSQLAPVSGNGRWDYVTVDDTARRVYIAHESEVDVLDADSDKQVGKIEGLQGVHGVAIAPNGQGFITNGKSDHLTVFEASSLKKTGEIKTGRGPDAVLYDQVSDRVFVVNGDGNSMTVVDVAKDKVIRTIPLKGAPEFTVSDNNGHVFVNLEDKAKVLQIDTKRMEVMNRWSVAPGASPASMAIDHVNYRLFIGCRNSLLIVMDALNGKVINSLPLGDHVDATAYDPVTHRIINSNGDGTLTVVAQDDADHYHVEQIVHTLKYSKTLGLDLKTHNLFVPGAEFDSVPAASKDNPKQRPAIIPGSFKVLVFERSKY